MSAARPGLSCPCGYQHKEIANERLFVFFDAARRWLHCSQDVPDFLGYSKDELLGQTADKLLAPGSTYKETVWEQFLSEGRVTRLIPLTKKSGQVVGVWIDYIKLEDGCMVAILRPL